MEGPPLPGVALLSLAPTKPSCKTGSFILIVHPASKHEKLYPRAVLGAWRAESKGQFEGDVHNLYFLCTTAFPASGARKQAEGSHPQNGISGQDAEVYRLRDGFRLHRRGTTVFS